jgi:L-fucose isomerase-like protein
MPCYPEKDQYGGGHLNPIDKKTCFGLIVGTRGFFNPELAADGRKKILARMKDLDFDYVILDEKETPTGCIETIADAKKCAALFREEYKKIDGIVVLLPNFGDELGVVNAVKESALNVPVLLQASDDDMGKFSVAERRDSFCGKLSVANNFWQYGIPFTDTTTHTCKIDSDAFKSDLERFASICRVVNGLRHARIGSIGARPGAFQTMRVSEKLLQASGVTVITVDHSQILDVARNMDENSEAVQAKLKEIGAYGTIPVRVRNEAVVKQAKYSVAVEDWMAENECDASCIQCWTSIQESYGCATCLTMSMMGEKLKPSACEVDIAGSISMYALTLAGREPAALLDWNNNYGDDRDKCICTHCSNYPKSFIGKPVEISELDILGNTLGRENCFGAVKGKVESGAMTYFRISTDDFNGRNRCYLGEGEFTDDPCDMDGGVAVCHVPGLQKLMKYMVKNGFEHHVGMVRGRVAEIVEEAASTYLGWDVYRHEG